MKNRKNKLIKLLKIGVLLFGVSLLLWNCENDNVINHIETQNSIPTISESKEFLLKNNNTFKNKKTNTFLNKIDWNNSTKKYFKQNTNLLYSPIKLKSNKLKSFIASIKRNGKVDSRIITLHYNNNNPKIFSGTIFIHNENGRLTEFYKYKNGKKEAKYNVKKIENMRESDSDDYTCYELADLQWLLETSDGASVFEILGPCVTIGNNTDEGGGGVDTNPWYTPSDFLNDDFDNNEDDDNEEVDNNYNSGGGNNWYTPSCGEGYILDENNNCIEDDKINLDPSFENSFANCAYKLLTENNLLKDILKKLIPKDSEYDVTFKVGNSSGSGGDTSATYGINGDIIVTINKDLVDTGNVVSISETILHEAVHAKLFEMVKSIGGLDKLNEFTNEDSEIGKLAACYNKYGKPELQHEFIWENYVKEIAIGTEIIHKLFPENYNRFHNYMDGTVGYTKDSFYESVAKAGLNNTSYFKKLDTTKQQTFLLLYGSLKVNGKKLSDYKNCK